MWERNLIREYMYTLEFRFTSILQRWSNLRNKFLNKYF
jgi:hypothetical protein